MGLWTDILWKLRRPVPPVPDHRLPPQGVVTTFLPPGYTIRGRTDAKDTGCKVYSRDGRIVVDGEWERVLDCRKQQGDGGQGEHQDPVARCLVPVHFRRLWVRNNKNALLLWDDSIVEDCIWLTVGEDAVANPKQCEDARIVGCTFLNSTRGDKTIQLNGARGAVVKGNTIYLGRTGIRVGESSYSKPDRDRAVVEGNTFIGVDSCIHPSSCTVEWNGNKTVSCRKETKPANGARLV